MADINARLVKIFDESIRVLNSASFSSEAIITQITEWSADLTGADFSAYFRNSPGGGEDVWEMQCMHPDTHAEAMKGFPHPRSTSLFAPIFSGQGIVRSDDIATDERYGSMGGMPSGHFPVRSFLGAPVRTSDGKIQGALLFGHHQPGRFSPRLEIEIERVTALTGLVLDRAKHVEALQEEVDRSEILVAEINHRSNNMLATVQSIMRNAGQGARSIVEYREAVDHRILSLAQAHMVLSQSNWSGGYVCEIINREISTHLADSMVGLQISGPRLLLQPAAVVAFQMAIHELVTNAAKYGAIQYGGTLEIAWEIVQADEGHRFVMQWVEMPRKTHPRSGRKGYGSILLHRLGRQFGGDITPRPTEHGFRCTIDVPLANIIAPKTPLPFMAMPKRERARESA